jgi:hypothetical protein
MLRSCADALRRKLASPQGPRQFNVIKGLPKNGTLNRFMGRLAFLARVSHQKSVRHHVLASCRCVAFDLALVEPLQPDQAERFWQAAQTQAAVFLMTNA